MQETRRPVRFERVLSEELELIAKARRLHGVGAEPMEADVEEAHAAARARTAALCGLALSGGGIRSATFNLGIIQALARHRLLGHFDYISTVSGGGYVGGWLSAWIHRHAGGVYGVQRELREALLGARGEPREVGWLRDCSNYLMPRLGYFSGDSWATISIYLRNLCLNLILIVACLGFALLLPRLLIHALDWIPAQWLNRAGLALFAAAVACIIVNLEGGAGRAGWLRAQPGVLAFVVIPGLIGSMMLAHALVADFPAAVYARAWLHSIFPAAAPMYQASWILAGAALYTLPWLIGAAASLLRPLPPANKRFRWELVILFAPFAGAAIGWLAYGYSQLALGIALAHWDAATWLLTGFGTPLVVAIVGLAIMLHVGLVSRGFTEDIREWWGRFGGWMLLAALAWAAGFAVVVYAPAVVTWAGQWMAAVGLTWILSTLAGVLLGRSTASGGARARGLLARITGFLPFVFVAGLVVAIAVGVHAALAPGAALCRPPADIEAGRTPDFAGHAALAYCELSLTRIDELATLMLALAAVAFLLQLRVDVNVFSLAPLYRNRLIRCYLGASRQSARRPHPFTGFDREDDLPLYDLGGPASSRGPARPQRPYPIVNAAINLTTGQKLAWQQRKAGSFVFTPLYCGYQMPDEGGARWLGRYCPTLDYVSGAGRGMRRGAVALSNAMTVSGAAASPNAGYHSSRAVAFLLTVFSVRLGSWFQNPRLPEVWSRPGPSHSLKPLLSELFGLSNDRSDFVYLSDGGHFENLGVYELVRRRCRFIVACDAGCDPKSSFEDLGNAIRKCRIDLGVDIELDTAALAPAGDGRLSPQHCALGLVRYDRLDAHGGVGYLLYIKASVTGREPPDVAQYRAEHAEFPHQPTADQFFDEPQFESYRRLGLHVGETVFAAATARSRDEQARDRPHASEDGADIDLERLFKELRRRWHPRLPLADGTFARHGLAFERIVERIRSDDRLRFLDRQLYPEWAHLEHEVGAASPDRPWLPDDVHALRAGFYLCESILQLMENVYLDLGLEETYDHPDNRGWMNRFRRFAAAGMVRVAWAVAGGGFGARFQSFCEHHLGLGRARIQARPPLAVARARADTRAAEAGYEGLGTLEALLDANEILPSDLVVVFDLVIETQPGAAGKGFGFPVAFAVLRPESSRAARTASDARSSTRDAAAARPDSAAAPLAAPTEPGAVPAPSWPMRLRYFRVGDHLQRMGLGWRVTLTLLDLYAETELDLATRAPALRTPATDADRTRYTRLFRAAKRISARERRSPEPASRGRGTLP